MFGKRILILAPHPDDEVVACATAILRARAAGAEIFALYLTHGCIAKDAMWPWARKNYDAVVARRRAEAEKAAALLGITPVSWSACPARHIRFAMHEVHAEIAACIAHYGIDQIWAPAYEGGNTDHDAVNALASSFVPHISVLEFAEYNFCDGKARSQDFPAPRGGEVTIKLSLAEQQKKRMALAAYASEAGNLGYVHTKQEIFRPLAAYDYARPPHEGTLWYARFQWVPFRHPRVDFTKPEDVSAAIAGFFAALPALNQPAAPRDRQGRART
jgi:LmbE family N-acetylglucosaminyl deacetylase